MLALSFEILEWPQDNDLQCLQLFQVSMATMHNTYAWLQSCVYGCSMPTGGLPYERGGDAHLKFWIIPLKETNLGVVQPFLTPVKTLIAWIE